jgi:hypothetical protein
MDVDIGHESFRDGGRSQSRSQRRRFLRFCSAAWLLLVALQTVVAGRSTMSQFADGLRVFAVCLRCGDLPNMVRQPALPRQLGNRRCRRCCRAGPSVDDALASGEVG